jgi:hypothetical protein
MQVETLTLGGPEHLMMSFDQQEVRSGPSWRRVGGLGRPSCFTIGQRELSLGAALKLDSSLLPPGTPISAQSVASTNGDAPDLRFEGRLGDAGRVDLQLVEGAVGPAVGDFELDFVWARASAGGAWVDFDRTGPVLVLQTLAQPWDAKPYDLAVATACRYARGARNDYAACLAICQRVARAVRYDPNSRYARPAHKLLLCKTPCRAGCEKHAELMSELCASVGVKVDDIYLFGGHSPRKGHDVRRKYWFDDAIKGWTDDVSLQLEHAAQEDAPKDPHFSHHRQIGLQGSIFDPSYGTAGPSIVIEVEGGKPRPGLRAMTTGALWHASEESEWVCLHSSPASFSARRRAARAQQPPSSRFAAIDVHGLVAELEMGMVPLGSESTPEGFVHSFRGSGVVELEITAGIFSDDEESRRSFARQNDSIQSPGGRGPAGIADEILVWPGIREDAYSGLLYRRSNLVIYARGLFGDFRIADVAVRIADAVPRCATQGTPDIPVIRFDDEIETGVRDFAVEWSREEVALGFYVTAEQKTPPRLHAASPQRARIRRDQRAITFTPVQPGRQECVVVAMTSTGAVGRRSLWVEVGPAPSIGDAR